MLQSSQNLALGNIIKPAPSIEVSWALRAAYAPVAVLINDFPREAAGSGTGNNYSWNEYEHENNQRRSGRSRKGWSGRGTISLISRRFMNTTTGQKVPG